MGLLDRYYMSAPIDCLLRSRREGRVAVFFFTNGNHFGTHLSKNRDNSEWRGDKVIKKPTKYKIMNIRWEQFNIITVHFVMNFK